MSDQNPDTEGNNIPTPEAARQAAEESGSRAAPCSLYRSEWELVGGRFKEIRTQELYCFALVEVETGRVEMAEIYAYDETPFEPDDGWEWRRFRLVEANGGGDSSGEA